MSQQQDETLNYFRAFAKDWKRKAEGGSPDHVNVIKQRNDYVVAVAKLKKAKTALDAGCGTGELVCELGQLGMNAVGIDFSKEMIEFCKKTAAGLNVRNVEFHQASIFDYDYGPANYDVISGNGLIEYISYDQLRGFLSVTAKALKKGGSLVLGSRNRLFNVFSLNRFTKEEIQSGDIVPLFEEAIALAESKSISDFFVPKVAALQKPEMKHASTTGIKVETRFQYTPMQLMKLLGEFGFKTVDLFPVHIHGISNQFKDAEPGIHAGLANLLQNYAAKNWSLIPRSSSFMTHAELS